VTRHHRGSRRTGRNRDDGVVLVLVALVTIALLLFAAIAIDGGSAYANRRQMQNAADAGAFSGTRAIEKLTFNGETDGGIIWDAIDDSRTSNEATSVKCWLVGPVMSPGVAPTQLTTDVCTSRAAMASAWATLESQGTTVAGVEVEQTGVKETYFASVAGQDTITARATATATLQPLVAGAGGSPFIVCASATADGFDIWDIEENQIKPSALNAWYGLQGAQSDNVPDCGAQGEAFDGKGGEDPPVIGEWIDAGNGNGFDEDILSQVVASNPCTPDMSSADGCLMVLPLASAGRGNGVSIEMYIVGFGVFEVYGNGKGNVAECKDHLPNPTPKYCGVLIGAGQITNGTGGAGEIDPNNPYLIKLVG
jgi:Flp pilus assembly protein TadG